jgi:hypothetical protein
MWAVRHAVDDNSKALPSHESWTFSVPKVCSLPTEWHRVCCLCSGLPPERVDGNHEYRGVPPMIQKGIYDRLSLGNILEEN